MKIKKTITLSFLSDYFPIPIRVSYCTGTVYLGSEFFFYSATMKNNRLTNSVFRIRTDPHKEIPPGFGYGSRRLKIQGNVQVH